MDDDFVENFIKPFANDKEQLEANNVEAQNLLKSELIEAQNLLKSELIEAQNLLDCDLLTSENIIIQGHDEAQNLLKSTLIESLNSIDRTVCDSEKLFHHVIDENKNLEKEAIIEIENLKASAKVESENLKRLADSASENITHIEKIELENSRNYTKIVSENLKRTAMIRGENLQETAKVSAENLKRSAQIGSSNLKEIAKTTTLNLKRTAEKESENLRQTAITITLNLMSRANSAVLNMQRIAVNTSDKIKENTRVHSVNTVTKTFDQINEMKHEKSFKKLQIQNKNHVIIIAIMFVVLISGGMLYSNNIISIVNFAGVVDDGFRTQYLVQNLRGDTVDTWASWRIPVDAEFHAHVLDSKFTTKDRVDAILSVIMSDKEIEIDDAVMHKGPAGTNSVYYEGWHGALNSITSDTKFNITKNIHFHVDKGESTGNIVIMLTDMSSPDGYSGYTNSIVDEVNHQILKSTITIYDVNKLSIEDLKTILRHELGHGFGLAHSTALEDLMYPVITTNYPYISECNLDAISHLYDGGDSSQVVCEK